VKRESNNNTSDGNAALFQTLPAKGIKKTNYHFRVTMMAQAISFLLQISSSILLARMLTPADFGLVAMVGVIANFIAVFKDLGLAQASVQRESISHAQISTLFWINAGLSVVLGLFVIVCAPLIAWAYHDERLVLLSVALALPIMISGFSLQHRALLQRNFRFIDIAQSEIIALVISIASGLAGAYFGMGYWALALMQVTNALCFTALIWSKTNWTPCWIKRNTGVRSMLGFGINLSSFNFLNYCSRNVDSLLIGRYLGVDSLGQYSRAYSLMFMPIRQLNGPLSSVYLPTLSRLCGTPDEFRLVFLQLIRWLSIVTTPLSIVLIATGDQVISVLLGEQWSQAGELFRVLAFAALFQPLGSFSGTLLTALGQTRRLAKWGVFSSILITSSFIIGIQYGVFGVAVAYAIATKIQQPILLWYSLRYAPVTVTQYLGAMLPGICLGGCVLVTWIVYELAV